MNEISTTTVKPFLSELQVFMAAIGLAMVTVQRAVATWAQETEIQYERGARMKAVRRRREWKVGDARHLRTLPHARISTKRLDQLENSGKRGRPVVQPYVPLPKALTYWAKNMEALFDPTTPPHVRLNIMKKTRRWPEFVESLYRGCYLIEKAKGLPEPSVTAEKQAADLLLLSPATLHKLCTEVRRQFKSGEWPMGQPLTPAEFTHWKETGELPGGPKWPS
jgi:hypothetical protein